MEKIEKFWSERLNEYLAVEDESRKKTLYPELLKIINDIGPSSILDYGCGDGDILTSLVDKNIELGVYDISKQALDAVNRRFNGEIPYYKQVSEIDSEAYELVVCSLVLMTIPDEPSVRSTLKNIKRVKKKRGVSLFAVTHPCFREHQFSTFVTEYTNKNPFYYLKDGEKFEVTMFDPSSNNKVSFYDYHWTLSKMLNLIIESGMAIKFLTEVQDSHEKGNDKFPPYLIIAAS